MVVRNIDTIDGLRQVAMTGYSIKNLKDIEYAFENAPGDSALNGRMSADRITDPEWMFNGLMAVVDVLAEIHDIDLKVREDAKSLFVRS